MGLVGAASPRLPKTLLIAKIRKLMQAPRVDRMAATPALLHRNSTKPSVGSTFC